jgi:hypothetical protein
MLRFDPGKQRLHQPRRKTQPHIDGAYGQSGANIQHEELEKEASRSEFRQDCDALKI